MEQMGFGSRSASIMRYRVKGELVGPLWDAVHEGIQRGKFTDAESAGDVVAMGWTSAEDFTDNGLQPADCVRDHYVSLAFRVDTVRVPPRILEMQFKAESKKILQETGRKRLSSAQVREVKEALKEKLRTQILPSIQVFDLIWDTSRGVAYLATLGVKGRERVEDLFKKSFGLTLIPIIPFIRAQELLEEPAQQRLLEQVQPSSFVP
ncbi:MAG: hypothetical protein V2B18_15910 [Pseudomonadota bacterium]